MKKCVNIVDIWPIDHLKYISFIYRIWLGDDSIDILQFVWMFWYHEPTKAIFNVCLNAHVCFQTWERIQVQYSLLVWCNCICCILPLMDGMSYLHKVLIGPSQANLVGFELLSCCCSSLFDSNTCMYYTVKLSKWSMMHEVGLKGSWWLPSNHVVNSSSLRLTSSICIVWHDDHVPNIPIWPSSGYLLNGPYSC